MTAEPWEESTSVDLGDPDTPDEGAAVTLTPLDGGDAPDIATVTSVDFTVPMTSDEAQQVTESIRGTAEMMWTLLARAHAGRAWEALGYPTFAEYVREEFDMSRSRAYQLLDQSRVIDAIEEALPDGTDFTISEAAARDLKGILGEVTPALAARTADLGPGEAGAVAAEIVEDYRSQVQERREEAALAAQERAEDNAAKGGGEYDPDWSPSSYPDPGVGDEDGDDGLDPTQMRRHVQSTYDLFASLHSLTTLPDPQTIIDIIPEARRYQINSGLPKAVTWLQGFKELWDAQPWQGDTAEDGYDPDADDYDE